MHDSSLCGHVTRARLGKETESRPEQSYRATRRGLALSRRRTRARWSSRFPTPANPNAIISPHLNTIGPQPRVLFWFLVKTEPWPRSPSYGHRAIRAKEAMQTAPCVPNPSLPHPCSLHLTLLSRTDGRCRRASWMGALQAELLCREERSKHATRHASMTSWYDVIYKIGRARYANLTSEQI